MKKFLLFLIPFHFILGLQKSNAQLILTEQTSAIALAQKLVGNGVTITNATFTGNSHMGGFFNNVSGTNIGIDSGIVLCTGRIKSELPLKGMDGDGVTTAINISASNNFLLPGDPDISNATGAPSMDAAILEFDFVPLGDSINVKYVFASEEYGWDVVCYFVDAFGFFISGPGITGLKNIALVPNTTTPVSNTSINGALNLDGTDCRVNQIYYVDNTTNSNLIYDGHTVVLKASEKVQPCQVYHLKLVIADLDNGAVDSGVFLESKSLSSNTSSITNLTQTDPSTGNYYVVEGCSTGSIKVKRQVATASAQTVNLTYAGTALNTIDVNTLPASVVIPANQTEVLLNITPVIDNLSEGVELLKIYTMADAACAVGSSVYTDSTLIEIRDYDTLSLVPSTANICRNSSLPLTASSGYTVYAWDANATLSNGSIRNPLATPTANATTYYCTASIGNCHARDSVFIRWKDIELLSTKNINCKNGTTGQIKIAAGPEWVGPLLISINNNAFQSDSTFNNLPAGTYSIKVKDATGCIDSISVTLTQAYPDLAASAVPVAATCSGNADGLITVNANGGLSPYQYSINNGTSFQNGNTFNVLQGNYPLIIKDFNNCLYNTAAIVSLNNDLTLSVANAAATICEGDNTTLQAVSNAVSYAWTPVTGLSNPSAANTQASPVTTTKYYIIATKGICTKKDSIVVNVNAAPIANAGTDSTVCFGGNTSLIGSGGIDYSWTPATYLDNAAIAQPTVIRPINNTTYSLQVKDANGCKSLNTAQVKVFVTPAVQLFAPRDTIAAIYQPLQLYAIDINNSGINAYQWSPAYGLNNTNIPRPITTLDRDMIYTVTGKTAAGCEGTATVSVKVFEGPEIYVPTAFTPNGDNTNDILRAKPIGIKTYNYFRIYNRWGQLMFSTSDFSKGWDGTIKGLSQNTGTYVWMAEGIDFKGRVIKRKGSTLLIK